MQIPFQKLIIQTIWCLPCYSLQVWAIPYDRLLPWIALLQWFKVQSNNDEHRQILKTGKIHLQAECLAPVSSFASSNIQGGISFFSEFKAEVHLERNQDITLPTWYKLVVPGCSDLHWRQAPLAIPSSRELVEGPESHFCVAAHHATCACWCVSITLPGWSSSDHYSCKC